MDFKKLVPWNWFKNEEEESGATVAAQQDNHMPQRQLSGSINQLHQEMDKLFDNFFQGFGFPSHRVGSLFPSPLAGNLLKPMVDIGVNDKEYTISIEVPGVDLKDIKLEVVNNTLTISGEKKQEEKEKGKNHYRVERSYGSFQRVLALPDDANQDKVQASYKKGVLTVTMPRKALPNPAIKQINIK